MGLAAKIGVRVIKWVMSFALPAFSPSEEIRISEKRGGRSKGEGVTVECRPVTSGGEDEVGDSETILASRPSEEDSRPHVPFEASATGWVMAGGGGYDEGKNPAEADRGGVCANGDTLRRVGGRRGGRRWGGPWSDGEAGNPYGAFGEARSKAKGLGDGPLESTAPGRGGWSLASLLTGRLPLD